MILRRVKCVEVEEAGFGICAFHFFETERDQFFTDYFEKTEIGMFFSRPSFCHWCFDVVFLEFCFSPFACDYEFWRELRNFFGSSRAFFQCPFAFVGYFENPRSFICFRQQLSFLKGLSCRFFFLVQLTNCQTFWATK